MLRRVSSNDDLFANLRPVSKDAELKKKEYRLPRYGPMAIPKHLTSEQIASIRARIYRDKAKFYIVPTVYLKEAVAQGTHPILAAMPDNRKVEILSGCGIPVETEMIMDYIEGKLDARNVFILNNSEIFVEGFGGGRIVASGGI